MRFLKLMKLNAKIIFKTFVSICTTLYSIIAVILSFITWDDIGIESKCCHIMILIGFLVLSIILAVIYILIINNSRVIWENGSGKIKTCYADIMKKAFPRNNVKDRIVVIPVNTCFDTIVDNNIASVDKPIVSPSTLHGQWVNAIIKSGLSQYELDKRINDYLKVKNIKPIGELTLEQKGRGNRLYYKRGAVVAFPGANKVTYFLLALSVFDEHNNAQCSKDEFIDSIRELIDFYNKNGQGFEMYLPLMGTNLSRVGLSHSDALHIITTLFELYGDQIHGEVNIIVYSKEKDKVSIFNT